MTVPFIPPTPIGPDDLLTPAGVLQTSLWPDLDAAGLTARLQGYIDAGAAALDDRGLLTIVAEYIPAQRAYSYWHAYLDVFTELALSPVTTALAGSISAGYAASNQKLFKDLSDLWYQRYEDLVGAALALGSDAMGASVARVSRQVCNVFSF